MINRQSILKAGASFLAAVGCVAGTAWLIKEGENDPDNSFLYFSVAIVSGLAAPASVYYMFKSVFSLCKPETHTEIAQEEVSEEKTIGSPTI